MKPPTTLSTPSRSLCHSPATHLSTTLNIVTLEKYSTEQYCHNHFSVLSRPLHPDPRGFSTSHPHGMKNLLMPCALIIEHLPFLNQQLEVCLFFFPRTNPQLSSSFPISKKRLVGPDTSFFFLLPNTQHEKITLQAIIFSPRVSCFNH